MRQQILALRDDPAAAAAMAGAFTQQNAALLAQKIGRTPSEGELYVAHFFGAAGAGQLINLVNQSPDTVAARAFPNAAKANPSIFYDRQGHPRSVAGVYRVLVARYDVARASPGVPATAIAAAAAAQPVAAAAPGPNAPVVPAATANAAPAGPYTARPGFHSLFSDNQQPVSQFVRDLWTSNPRVAAALSGQAAASAAAPDPPAAPSAPLDLFSDRPSDVRALFGQKS
jgi:hypothetical protein